MASNSSSDQASGVPSVRAIDNSSSSSSSTEMSSPPVFSVFPIHRQIFYTSALSRGIVNLKPLVPGHVLVIPKRVAPRVSDLTPNEAADLMLSAQSIGRVIEDVFKASSLTYAIQDGPAAGQSVPHVHMHILPRKDADFEPQDAIYEELDTHGAANATPEQASQNQSAPGRQKFKMDAERQPRTPKEMEEEAEWLATFFSQQQQQ